jgi:serine/threonine protein kinase
MVTGQVPFVANTATETLALILQKEPPPLTRYSDEVPPELERIVAKALTKDREERYQSAKDLLIDLRNLKRKLEVSAEIERTASPELHTNESSRTSNDGTTAATRTTRYQFVWIRTRRFDIHAHKLATLVVALVLASALIAIFAYSRSRKSNATFDSIAVLPFETLSSDQILNICLTV